MAGMKFVLAGKPWEFMFICAVLAPVIADNRCATHTLVASATARLRESL
jgi:hypothetical protein